MDVQPWQWVAFAAFVVVLLLLDLELFGRRGKAVSLRRAVGWSVGWTVLGLGFAGFLWVWQGRDTAGAYLAGFLIEKSLSVDNLFVFALVLAYFGVPAIWQRRALFWGIVGAIMLRALFIAAGAALLDAFHFTTYVFGGFLVLTGVRIGRDADVHVDPERNPVLVVLRRALPMTVRFHDDRMVVREEGRLRATPMLAALVGIATFDVVFAVDSIPAVFAVTREPFVVYAANAFSLLGLASLYFVLAGVMTRFRFLNIGLAVVLVFVGAKMTLSDVVTVPVVASLLVVVFTLAAAIAASILSPGPRNAGRGRSRVEVAPGP
ncbi:MAG TPA: TerC/Alx family metal homeostasis membrane protein [Gaiellaceae bacterium]|nr:TerC/Alx family metal homeostasis membrane protein [Gaiellaceae bacterium]